MMIASNLSVICNPEYINANISKNSQSAELYVSGKVVQEIPNLFSQVTFTILSTKHTAPIVLINKTIDFCAFMEDTSRNLFLKSFYETQVENGRLPKRCLIQKVM